MELAALIERYQDPLECRYGTRITANQEHALSAIGACRTARYGEMVLECADCHRQQHCFHACGHRSCPRCQNHDTTRWLDRQRSKLLPVHYFMVTFTLPFELRALAQQHPTSVYNALFACASSTLKDFAVNDKKLGASIGLTAVLHTHSRRLEYHPHLHIVVPGGCIDSRRRQWKKLRGKYLFNEFALAKVFRARMLEALRQLNLPLPESVPGKWVVDCANVGKGEPALKYLSRYLYRGVINERNIIADDSKQVTFRYTDSETGETQTRKLDGEAFVWLLLQHVLPKGFRRARDYGFLHGKATALLSLVQQILRVHIEPPLPTARPVMHCPHCNATLRIIAFIAPAWRAG